MSKKNRRASVRRSPKGTLARHTPKREVTVKVDAALKKRWDALIAIVHESRGKESQSFDRLWETVGEIVANDLHLIGGFKDAPDFFDRELGEKERNAWRYIKVATFASPQEEEQLGITRIDAALSYIDAKVGAPVEHPPLPIRLEKLRIPLSDGSTVPLKDAHVPDIEAATRALKKRSSAPTSSAERGIREHLQKHAAFKGVRVRVRNGLVNIIGVPAASLGVFCTVLREAKWASREDARGKRKRRR